MKSKGFLILLAIILMVCIVSPVIATDYPMGEMDGSIETVETHYYDNKYETYYASGSNPYSDKIVGIYLTPIEHWETVILVLYELPAITTSIGGNKQHVTFKIGATYIGSGYVTSWQKNATHSMLLVEFDDYDRKTYTGTQVLAITYDGGGTNGIYTSRSASGAPPWSPYVGLMEGPTYAGITTSEIWSYDTYYLKVERDGTNVDETNCTYINNWNLYRYDTARGKWAYSAFDLRDGDGLVYHQSTSGSANVYNVSSVTAPIILTVNYGNPSIQEDVYTWSGSSTCYPEGTPTLTPTPTITPYIPNQNCNLTASLSLSKNNNIFPVSEYITGIFSLTGSGSLPSGSSIHWMMGPGPGSGTNPYSFATFTNVSGTWKVQRNDLGNVTALMNTTYSDALSEDVRFPTDGNYIMRVSAITASGCALYDEEVIYVNPTSGVNVDFYFYDGLTGGMIPEINVAYSNVGITGNVTLSYNPISVSAQIGNNLSIYAVSPGYTTKHIYYTVPYPPGGGNTLNVPFYMFPENLNEYYVNTTVWTVTVKDARNDEPLYGASVRASNATSTIDTDTTNSQGYVMLQIPYGSGSVRLDVSRFMYTDQTQYVTLSDVPSYSTTIYLGFSGTPVPTTIPTYNPNATATIATPTTTMTTIQQTTVSTRPRLVVDVYDSQIGSGEPIFGATVKIVDGDEVDETYVGQLIQSTTTALNGRTPYLQMDANRAYWISVNKTGYYDHVERFRMSSQDATMYIALIPIGEGVTVEPTSTFGGGGTGSMSFSQGGWIAWLINFVMENFGVDEVTARLFLGLAITLVCAVFVGGSLSGFGSGEGAGMGALIGGCFGWAIVCVLQLVYIWLLPVSIAFVGMAFFLMRRGGGE